MAAWRTDTRPQQVQCSRVAREQLYREENEDEVISVCMGEMSSGSETLQRRERAIVIH